MRILLGSAVTAAALLGAVYLQSGVKAGATHWQIGNFANDRTLLEVSSAVMPGAACNPRAAQWHQAAGPACVAVRHRASWQTPLTLLIVVAGLGAGVGIILKQ